VRHTYVSETAGRAAGQLVRAIYEESATDPGQIAIGLVVKHNMFDTQTYTA